MQNFGIDKTDVTWLDLMGTFAGSYRKGTGYYFKTFKGFMPMPVNTVVNKIVQRNIIKNHGKVGIRKMIVRFCLLMGNNPYYFQIIIEP